MRHLALSCLVVSTLLVAGCPSEVDPGLDGGTGPLLRVDAGGPGADGGPPPGDGGPVDVPPPDPEALAEELCVAYRRGLVSLELLAAQRATLPASRCSNDDALVDVATRPELGELPAGACTLGDELRRLFQIALEGGRVEIDPAAFRACIERGRALRATHDTAGEIEAREAALLALPDDPSCAAAVTPLVGEGGDCVQAWDCVAPLRCEADPIEGGALRCLPPALEGERCVVTAPSGQENVRTCATGNACVLGICTRRVDANEACDPAGVPCVEGLVCSPASVCAPPGPPDSPCARDEHCEAGLVCGPAGTCAAPVPALEDGAPCATDGGPGPGCASPCSVCRPDDDGELRCLDRGAAGAPCATLDHCRAGLYCAPDTSLCAPYRALGEACDGDDPCAAGLACTDQEPPRPADAGPVAPPLVDGGVPGPTCHALPSIGDACQPGGPYVCGEGTCLGGVCVAGVEGDPCTGDNTCAGDLICVQGTCARPPRAGAPCAADGRCEAGSYCDGERCRPYPSPGEGCAPNGRCTEGAFCSEGTCEALRVAGAACPNDGACVSGRCLDTGVCATTGPSCYSTEAVFAQLLGLSLLLPVVGLLRRRRRR